MKTYDKSLTEVWEWKDKVLKDFSGLNNKDLVKKLKEDADKILSDASIRLPSAALRKNKKSA
ncbi:MAG: hypothetical protein WCQ99_13985 [Pseudomonadota bacterium]